MVGRRWLRDLVPPYENAPWSPIMSPSPPPARFLFVACQVGAERAVKGEVARRWPEFRFAYSRPGFLTFKLPEQQYLTSDFNLLSVFARAYGFSLGKVPPDDPAIAAQQAWNLLGDRPIRRIHVWERDRAEPGFYGFEPSITPAALATYEALRAACPHPEWLAPGNDLQQQADPGDWIADCVLVEPNEWWVGFHRARSVASRWPGGILGLDLPREAVSRAWLKMEEALRWSQLPATAGRVLPRSAVRPAVQANHCWGGDLMSSASIRPKWPRRFLKIPSSATFAAVPSKFPAGRFARSAGSPPI